MYSRRQHAEAERIHLETGMSFIAALRRVQMRDELRNRCSSLDTVRWQTHEPINFTLIK